MIIGIDPGPKYSGYVVWDGNQITDHGTMENEGLLHWLLAHHWGLHQTVIIEWITGYGVRVGQETFETCFWAGRFAQAANPGFLLARKAAVLHLCGNTTAGDKFVRQALIDRIGEPGSKKNPGRTHGISGHAWPALAVAVCWADQYGEVQP